MAERKRVFLLVAAIDIGTTYSGDAFSMKATYEKDPLKINTNQAWDADERQLLPSKIPTCLLLNSKKEFDSFGYEAENKYAKLVMDREQDAYYYFHRFKRSMYNKKNVNSETLLEDITGKTVLAIDVFSHSIRALVNHLMSTLTQGTGIKSNDILWVLTVPAIWTADLMQFMRKSALKAGLQHDRLLIVKESEAAFIFCQHLPIEKLSGAGDGFTMSKIGTKCMIVDLGGATVDVTVHEKLLGEGAKELDRATREDCGGTSVDSRFIELLANIFGESVLNTMKREHLADYLELLREFETVKRLITPTLARKMNMTLPYCTLDSLCKAHLKKNLTSTVLTSHYSDSVSIRGDRIRIDTKLIRSLFDKTIKRILELLEDMFERIELRTVASILLVGSFSECTLVQEAIQKAFLTRRVIVPEDSGLAVIKGAVIYGQNKKMIDLEERDVKTNVNYSGYFDIKKFNFTKRAPPPLFTDTGISDSAKDTCNTVVVGFEMTVSQHILLDGAVGTGSFGISKNGEAMLSDITRCGPIWFEDKFEDMFHRISEIKEILTAIKEKDHDKVMRSYYRSQHIHTFDEDCCPMHVQVHIEKDRLNTEWLPHIQTALLKIGIAAPGIKFINTEESFDGSTNYIKIGIHDPQKKNSAYTCYRNGYPMIHLGGEWSKDSMAGTSIHELLHALGFGHTMKRFDSSIYLDVKTDGLDDVRAHQYTSNPSYGMLTRFDLFSIMMYPENETMKRAKGDKIWDLKEGPQQMQDMSELDKVALNLIYKPCKSLSTYSYLPVVSETTNMLYCGREVMQSHNQNVPPTLTSICGPKIWANCPSCRVFKDFKSQQGIQIQISTVQKCLEEGRWQGLSGNFYCGKKYADEYITFRFDTCIKSDGVCGPDQGIPCTDCGEKLKSGYSYKDFNPKFPNRA